MYKREVFHTLNLLPKSSDSLGAKMELRKLGSRDTADQGLKTELILRMFCYPGIKLNASYFLAALHKSKELQKQVYQFLHVSLSLGNG